jgi:hypothetical protein
MTGPRGGSPGDPGGCGGCGFGPVPAAGVGDCPRCGRVWKSTGFGGTASGRGGNFAATGMGIGTGTGMILSGSGTGAGRGNTAIATGAGGGRR